MSVSATGNLILFSHGPLLHSTDVLYATFSKPFNNIPFWPSVRYKQQSTTWKWSIQMYSGHILYILQLWTSLSLFLTKIDACNTAYSTIVSKIIFLYTQFVIWYLIAILIFHNYLLFKNNCQMMPYIKKLSQIQIQTKLTISLLIRSMT